MRRLKRLSVLLFIVSLIMLGSHIFKVRMLDDRTGPVFHMDSRTIEVSVKDGQEALVKGLTATDAKDGDISDSIIVESVGPFTGTGSRIVNYAALDSDNHVTHIKREMVYTDYEPSRFHLSRPLSFAMNTVNLLNGISVEDSIDGDLTRNVRMMSDSEIDTAHVGEYSARLKATNSAGGISYLPVTVEIYDASVFHRLPLLNLKEYVAYVEKGADFDERDYLTSIVINGTSYSLTEEEVLQRFKEDEKKFHKEVNDRVNDYEKLDMDAFIRRIGGQERIEAMKKVNEKLDRSELINGKLVEKKQPVNENLDEWKKGLLMEEYLHEEMCKFVAPETTFEELYYHINGIIEEKGYINLDFMGNLGHSIVRQKNDRIYIEKGNQICLGEVHYFTFEPHISVQGSKYGYKRENIYYFENGEIKEL